MTGAPELEHERKESGSNLEKCASVVDESLCAELFQAVVQHARDLNAGGVVRERMRWHVLLDCLRDQWHRVVPYARVVKAHDARHDKCGLCRNLVVGVEGKREAARPDGCLLLVGDLIRDACAALPESPNLVLEVHDGQPTRLGVEVATRGERHQVFREAILRLHLPQLGLANCTLGLLRGHRASQQLGHPVRLHRHTPNPCGWRKNHGDWSRNCGFRMRGGWLLLLVVQGCRVGATDPVRGTGFVVPRAPGLPSGLLRLRGGMGGVEICGYSEVSISVSGSESGCYWDENFHLPKDIPPGVLGGPRNVSDVLGSLEARVEGQIVTDSGVDSAHRRPYLHHEEYDQLPPSHTLYVRNLRETVHPIRMRALLYAVFSQFGHSTLSQAQGRNSSMPKRANCCEISHLRELLEDQDHARPGFCLFQASGRCSQGQYCSGTTVRWFNRDSPRTHRLSCTRMQAKDGLSGFAFLNKTLVIQFAKRKEC